MISAFAVRSRGLGRRRPLCVRGHPFPGAMKPRTEAFTATDGGGGSGYPDRTHSFTPLTCYFRMLLAAVVSAHLGRTRRELRCGGGVESGLPHAYREGPDNAARSSANGGLVLAGHEEDPVAWEAPLPKALKATFTDSDAELIAAGRSLLA